MSQAQATYHGPAAEGAQQPCPGTARILSITPPGPAPGAPQPAPPVVRAVAQPLHAMATAHVLLPSGAQAGQQVQFTPPCGQHPMVFVVPAPVGAQGSITVQYPAQQLPAPAAELEDRHAASHFWMLYVAGFALCCVSPICSLCVWCGMAAVFFMKPAAVRGERPLQSRPARAAAATALAACACCLLTLSGVLAAAAFCGGDFDRCPKWHNPAGQPRYHVPVAPHSGKVNISLSGYRCGNGYGQDSNQRFIYEGLAADSRAYYRGATHRDMYVYYDGRCDHRDAPCGAWILGRKSHADRLVIARIASSDFALPVGPQTWDWIWCGDRRSPGHTLTVDVEMHPASHPKKVSQAGVPKHAAKSIGTKALPILPTKAVKAAEIYNMVV